MSTGNLAAFAVVCFAVGTVIGVKMDSDSVNRTCHTYYSHLPYSETLELCKNITGLKP